MLIILYGSITEAISYGSGEGYGYGYGYGNGYGDGDDFGEGYGLVIDNGFVQQ